MMRARSVRWHCLLGALAVLAASTFLWTPNVGAEDFDWRNVNGQNWVSPVQDQFSGNLLGFCRLRRPGIEVHADAK